LPKNSNFHFLTNKFVNNKKIKYDSLDFSSNKGSFSSLRKLRKKFLRTKILNIYGRSSRRILKSFLSKQSFTSKMTLRYWNRFLFSTKHSFP